MTPPRQRPPDARAAAGCRRSRCTGWSARRPTPARARSSTGELSPPGPWSPAHPIRPGRRAHSLCEETRGRDEDHMEYTKLGHTGLDVSRIALGCMTYGDPQRGGHEWTLDEEASRPLHPASRRARHQLLRHCQRLLRRVQRGDRRPGACRGRASGRDGHRHEGAWPDARWSQRRRAVAQGHPHRDRRQPDPAAARTTSTSTRSIAGTRPRRSRRPSRRCTTS